MTTPKKTATTKTPATKTPAKEAQAAKATTRTRRPAKQPVVAVTTFPASQLAYLDTALTGPLGPGGVAHRIVRYPIVTLNARGNRHTDYVYGGACQPTTTQPVPGSDQDEKPQTVPVNPCRAVSAAFAQARGVTRCTDPACWPVQPHETSNEDRMGATS
jgi:hypothetical protein